MGRRRKEETGLRDRIGEALDLEKCPECGEHTDCFSWIDGHCTALKESGGAGCVFYKPLGVTVSENKQIYRKLREKGRSDLIRAHEKAFAALGVFDEEIAEADEASGEFGTFEQEDYEKALADASEE